MQNPDCVNCPSCHTPKSGLRQRVRATEKQGITRLSFYNSCECGALTQSPKTGLFNLRKDVAEEAGVGRKTEASVLARIQPVIRKAASL